ncbi:hypothetical protein B6U91_00650 [Candidatus Pacearchaeota archaeon ex4484_71]|nr:MAG: hypothetical protein B6U91_00650 [Candidatus Pacearchaeota archaeon ex4484_71]
MKKSKKKEGKKAKSKKLRESARHLNIEVRKAVAAAIMAAFGFLIALVWRDVIMEWVETISAQSPVSGKLISALVVTFICVVGILLVTRFIAVKEK